MRAIVVRGPLAVLLGTALVLGLVADASALPIAWSVRSDEDDTLYEIDLATGVATPRLALPYDDIEGLAFHPTDGKLYAVDDDQGQLIRIDLLTLNVEVLPMPLGSGLQGKDVGLAFDGAGTLFLAAAESETLYTVDIMTGAANSLFPAGGLGDEITGLAYDLASSTLYGLGYDHLYTIDTNTGVPTSVGSLSTLSLDDGGIAFDRSGMLWGIEDDGKVFSIDKATGVATVLFANTTCPVSACDGFESLAILPEPGLPTLLSTGLLGLLVRRRRALSHLPG